MGDFGVFPMIFDGASMSIQGAMDFGSDFGIIESGVLDLEVRKLKRTPLTSMSFEFFIKKSGRVDVLPNIIPLAPGAFEKWMKAL
jgi:hypothetical protein